jgi:hypothetical protein
VARLDFDEVAFQRMIRRVAEQVRETVHVTAEDTKHDGIETAVATLRWRLRAVAGTEFSRDWCRSALETLRRGEPLEMVIR